MWPPGGSSARRAVSWPRWRAPIPTPDGRIPRDGLSAEGSDWAVWNGDWLPPLAPSLHGWGSDLRRRAVMSYREGMTHLQESLSQTPRGGGGIPPRFRCSNGRLVLRIARHCSAPRVGLVALLGVTFLMSPFLTLGACMTGDVTARREANRLAAKRYRARQRERAKAAERSGRGYSWPPFAPGHELSMVHGARSPRRVDPLAQELIDQLFALPDCPAALREPTFRWAVESWARVQAQIELVTAWIADQVAEHGLQEALSETSSAEETLSVRKGGTRKVTAGLPSLPS